MGFADERYQSKKPYVHPIELDCSGATATEFTLDFGMPVTLRKLGFQVSTTFNSTGDTVISVKNSSGTEKATLNIPTGTAAKSQLNSDELGTPASSGAIEFSDGIVALCLKTAATTAGKGYFYLLLNEMFA